MGFSVQNNGHSLTDEFLEKLSSGFMAHQSKNKQGRGESGEEALEVRREIGKVGWGTKAAGGGIGRGRHGGGEKGWGPKAMGGRWQAQGGASGGGGDREQAACHPTLPAVLVGHTF